MHSRKEATIQPTTAQWLSPVVRLAQRMARYALFLHTGRHPDSDLSHISTTKHCALLRWSVVLDPTGSREITSLRVDFHWLGFQCPDLPNVRESWFLDAIESPCRAFHSSDQPLPSQSCLKIDKSWLPDFPARNLANTINTDRRWQPDLTLVANRNACQWPS